MTRLRRVPTYLSAVALTGSLAACGGGSSPTAAPTPTPTPTPPPPQVVSQVTGGSLPAGFIAWVVFTTARAGALDATVDWTFATNDLDVYLAQGSCDNNTIATTACPILGFSESTTAKPETAHVASAPAGTYTIFVNNLGPGDETVSYQVVLTPSATGTAPLTASSRSGEAVPFQLKGRPRGGIELK
jgi:hypothetical protein